MLLKIAIFSFCAVCALVVAQTHEASPVAILPPNPPVTPGPPPNSTTTSPTTPKPTTTSKPTTTTTTTTTTTPPTTTSTTTPKPNTTTTTTTTTPKPTPPSPTPKPDDKPSINDYIGNYTGTKNICLMMKVAVQLEVMAKDKNSTMINVPKEVKYAVDCPQNTVESLIIHWNTNNSVVFQLLRNDSRYEIQSINTTLLLSGENTTKTFYHKKPEFSVSEKMSYYCKRDQPLNLTDGTNNETLAKIHLSHFQYQAFMNTTKADYASVWDCDGTNTSDVVPVVVGCVLAVLVVLVLVAYLFGRRRCQARGYLSM